ncbi:hypothetical protein ACNS7O_13600 [Haloferacaceae archaeon DSL9]
MTIPGYDPDDLEAALEKLLSENPDEELSEDEKRRHEAGEPLTDILDEDRIRRLTGDSGV